MDRMITMKKRFSESVKQHELEKCIAHKIVNLLFREGVKVRDVNSILTRVEAITKRGIQESVDNELDKIVCPTEEITSKV